MLWILHKLYAIYGIEQYKFLLQRKIEMDDDTFDEAAVAEEETKMDSTIKKPKWHDPRDYLRNCLKLNCRKIANIFLSCA